MSVMEMMTMTEYVKRVAKLLLELLNVIGILKIQ